MLSIEVEELLNARDAHLELELVAGKRGLSRKINIPRIQKPGLALIGNTSQLHPGRVQVFGKSENTYLKSLPEAKARAIIRKMCAIEISCFVVTRGNKPTKALTQEAHKKNVPVFVTPLATSALIQRLSHFLEERLTSTVTVHGVLMDIFGVGILIIGKSGLGKSESALDLVLKGHRLIADDIVEVKKRHPATLIGSAAPLLKHHLEIRGLGILNIKDLFGIAAVCDEKNVEIVVELVEWNPNYEYDRLGIDEFKYTILDIPIPYLKIPVSPGRNITTLVEVAARNNLLKAQGHYSSQLFEDKLNRQLHKNRQIKVGMPK